jgi:hypothetical protein
MTENMLRLLQEPCHLYGMDVGKETAFETLTDISTQRITLENMGISIIVRAKIRRLIVVYVGRFSMPFVAIILFGDHA